jgi:hypothetical protein
MLRVPVNILNSSVACFCTLFWKMSGSCQYMLTIHLPVWSTVGPAVASICWRYTYQCGLLSDRQLPVYVDDTPTSVVYCRTDSCQYMLTIHLPVWSTVGPIVASICWRYTYQCGLLSDRQLPVYVDDTPTSVVFCRTDSCQYMLTIPPTSVVYCRTDRCQYMLTIPLPVWSTVGPTVASICWRYPYQCGLLSELYRGRACAEFFFFSKKRHILLVLQPWARSFRPGDLFHVEMNSFQALCCSVT